MRAVEPYSGMTERLFVRVLVGIALCAALLALEFVQYRPAEAERFVRNREERREIMEKLERAYEGLHRAAQEFR